jgi:hypothetical protein
MLRGQLIALNVAFCLSVHRVQVQPMLARYQAQGLFHILTQLIGGSRFAGVGAGCHYTAAESFLGFIKSSNIITLPAMQ